MIEQGVCQGCCLNPGFISNPFACDFSPFHNPLQLPKLDFYFLMDGVKLTPEETELLKKLGESYNLYCSLDKRSEADNKEFVEALHRLQQIVALRVARRVNPEVWAQPE